jgi:beta-phosphoglucomutase family hydrolase
MNSSNNQPRAVLWDLDGTLIDSMPYHWEAWNETLSPLGYHFSIDSFKPTIGLRNEDIIRHHLKLDRTPVEIEQIMQAKEERYRAIVRERGLPLLAGVQHWLSWLQARQWRQAIVTSAPRDNVVAIQQATSLDKFMGAIICAEDVERGKPYPDPFLRAADRLGVSPANCVVIEDAPAGLEGARHAGMRTIGVLTTHKTLDADVVVKTLEDLSPDIFEKIRSH